MSFKKGNVHGQLNRRGPNKTIHRGGLVFVKLTKGKWAIVDRKDYPLVSEYRWYACKGGKTFYVHADYYDSHRHKHVLGMHRVILGIKNNTVEADHINHSGLDNRRKNIRLCDHAQNNQNRSKPSNNTSGWVGVSWAKREKRWLAQIKTQDKQVCLGYYICFKKAISARKMAEDKYFREFACKRGGVNAY